MRILIIIFALSFIYPVFAQPGWFEIETPPKPNVSYRSVYFLDSVSGFAVTNHPYYTSDGGQSWTGVESYYIFNVSFASRLVGIGGGTSGSPFRVVIVRTTDGGLNWQRMGVDSLGQIEGALQLVDSLYGYAATSYALDSQANTEHSYLLKTVDGGISWEGIQIEGEEGKGANYFSLAFANRDTGLVSVKPPFPSATAWLQRTYDGGKTWKRVGPDDLIDQKDITSHISSISHVRDSVWLFTHSAGLFRTTNNGDIWTRITSIYTLGLSCYNGKICYCYFGTNRDFDGYIYKSVDGGETWFPQYKTSHGVTSIFIINERVAYAGGFFGTLLKTIDGGGPPLSAVDLKSPDGQVTGIPNPSSDYFQVVFAGVEHSLYIEVFDALGRRMVKEVIAPQTSSHRLDVRSYPPGVYYARLGSQTVRFIKQ